MWWRTIRSNVEAHISKISIFSNTYLGERFNLATTSNYIPELINNLQPHVPVSLSLVIPTQLFLSSINSSLLPKTSSFSISTGLSTLHALLCPLYVKPLADNKELDIDSNFHIWPSILEKHLGDFIDPRTQLILEPRESDR